MAICPTIRATIGKHQFHRRPLPSCLQRNIRDFWNYSMPKDKRHGQSAVQKRSRRPYKARGKGSEGDSVGERDRSREDWEDSVCPICLESPHNAVLLICSSHADGCRPYMCNTSYRHSNCLNQYQKAQVGLHKSPSAMQAVSNSEEQPQPLVVDPFHTGDTLNLRIVDAYPTPPDLRPLRASTNSPVHLSDDADMENVLIEALNSRIASLDYVGATRRLRRNGHLPLLSRDETEASGMHFLDLEIVSEVEGLEESSSMEEHTTWSSSSFKNKNLVCPLCRGQIFGWRVINAARNYLNDKARNCSHELCVFEGTYPELRVHARCEHPFARPCEVDPTRQRDWLRMERQREIGDVLSTIGGPNEGMVSVDGHWWSYLFLLHFFGPTSPLVNEESIMSRLRHQGRSQRIGSARLRELVEILNHDGTNSTTGSRSSGEQMTGASERLLGRQRSRRGNVSERIGV